MTDWRVLLISALSFLALLAGLLALAAPDSYEGQVLYTFSEAHSVRLLDIVGVALLVVGSGIAWGAGLVWRRHVGPR